MDEPEKGREREAMRLLENTKRNNEFVNGSDIYNWKVRGAIGIVDDFLESTISPFNFPLFLLHIQAFEKSTFSFSFLLPLFF